MKNKNGKSPIVVIVNMKSSIISQSELYEITLTLTEETRSEPGCLNYNCYKSIDDDSVLEIISFESLDAHKSHMNSPHVLAFLDKYQALKLQFNVQRSYYDNEFHIRF